MANTLNIQASTRITNDGASSGLNRSFAVVPAGTNYFQGTQVAGSGTSTLAIGSCANLGYVQIYNPATNTATLTVTSAPMICKPGETAIFHPGNATITVQATAAGVSIQAFGSEA
jgi:hypothetical protein